MVGGIRQCLQPSRTEGNEGGGLHLQVKELLAGSFCPLGHSSLCLFSEIFFKKLGEERAMWGGPAFPLIAHRTEHPGYKRGCDWLPP